MTCPEKERNKQNNNKEEMNLHQKTNEHGRERKAPISCLSTLGLGWYRD